MKSNSTIFFLAFLFLITLSSIGQERPVTNKKEHLRSDKQNATEPVKGHPVKGLFSGDNGKDNGIPTVSIAPKSLLGQMEACGSNQVLLPIKTSGFTEVGAYNLTIKFDPDRLQLTDVLNTAGFPVFGFSSPSPDLIIVNGRSENEGFTLADSSVLFMLQFYYQGDSVPVLWFPWSDSCRFYTFPDFAPMLQEPVSSFYYDGSIIERPVKPVDLSITVSKEACCEDSALVFTANPVNGGTAPQYQWMVNEAPVAGAIQPVFVFNPEGNEKISCQLYSSEMCTSGNPATSNEIIAVVIPAKPVSVSITADHDTVCTGTRVTLSSSAVNGGTMPVYQWKINDNPIPGATNSSYNYIPSNNDIITCQVTSNEQCPTGNPATSQPIRINVKPILPVNVSVSASTTVLCDGASADFSANPVNGGGVPNFQWRVNNNPVAGATNSLFSYIPQHGDAVSCWLNSSEMCVANNPAVSLPVAMTVNPVKQVVATLDPGFAEVCAGNPVAFTTTTINGGNTPIYRWTVNNATFPGATNSTFSYTPVDGDAVMCEVHSSETCPGDNPVLTDFTTVKVNPVKPVNVTLGVSANPSCQGTLVTLRATPVNGGANPVYSWQLNGAATGSNSNQYSYVPANGDVVQCTMQSNILCPSGNPATSMPLSLTVIPPAPVSVSISSSLNNVCDGTRVTLSAFAINGGTAPTFQWKKNGQNAGSNSPVFSYFPANNDVITCIVTSNEPCHTGSPALSNAVTMQVYPKLPVSVSITSTAQTVCAGTSVSLTATPVHGGSSPVYQWRVNGSDVPGATGSAYDFIPVHGDSVSCKLTSNDVCTYHNPAISAPVSYVVYPNLPVSIQVTSSATEVCAGTAVSFTANPVNGGGNPAFQWKVDGMAISGATGSGYTYVPLNGDTVSCQLLSSVECPVGNPAISNILPIKVNPNKPVSVFVSATANPVCQGTAVTYKAKPVNGGPGPVYAWKVNGIAAGTNSSQYIYTPANNDLITCSVTSNIVCPTGNPATSEPLTMVVNPPAPVSITVVASNNNICAGTKVVYNAFPVNGGSSPVYQWKKNGISVGANSPVYEAYPQDNDVITCILTSNETCRTGSPATAAPITMVVHPVLPVSVSVTASVSSVCSGSRVGFTASPVNGGSTPAFQWKVNGTVVPGATSAVFEYPPVSGDQVECLLTSSEGCAANNPALSQPVSVIVTPLNPVSITVAPTVNNICQGTPVQFNATAANGGTAPTYIWKVNGQVAGNSSASYTYVPNNSDIITCQVTSNALCTTGNPALSGPVTMIVNPLLPVSATVAPSANNVCAGTSVTMSATLTNGGTHPLYQWVKNNVLVSGATAATYVFTPVNKDTIRCVVTSNAVCATGNPATSSSSVLNVNPLLPVSITTTASALNVCAGTSVQYTASSVNGGTAPAYQWMVNSVNVAGATTNSYTYTPVNNDNIRCRVTSNATCATGSPATSVPISMVVNPLLPVSVTVSASASQVCAGTQVIYNATPVNGGTAPGYQWMKNSTAIAGATSSTYTFAPVNGDAMSCMLTSNAICPTGNPALSGSIPVTVDPLLPVSVSVAASANPVCAGTQVTFTATNVNGGTTPVYQWLKNGSVISGNNTPSLSLIPVNSDVIICKVTSSATCATGNPATSNNLSMTVNPLKPVSVTISAPVTTLCAGSSAVFTASPVNGGSAPGYQWKKNGNNVTGATNVTYTFVPVNNDNVSCILTSNATCATGSPAQSNTQSLIVNPLIPVSAKVTATSYAVMPGTQVTFTATHVNGGTTPTYQWKVNNIVVGTNSSTYSYNTPANNDNVKCIVTSSLTGCLSGNPATSPVITMVVYSTGTACTGVPTVTYGGMVYNTVQVGTQCWLRENINLGTRVGSTVTQTNNGTVEKYCYVDDEYYCNFYGGLYQWAEMVQYYNGVTNTTHWNPVPTVNIQGICPSGWHLPTKAEMTTLITFIGGSSTAGGKMKEAGQVHWNSPNTGASNAFGFTALPGGNVYLGTFTNLKQYATFWTITVGPASAADAVVFGAAYNLAPYLEGQSPKHTGYSVRCLKN